MISGFWGKKIGMTQVFDQDKVVPVTAIDVSSWVVVGKKTEERDGYSAVQVAHLKNRYKNTSFTKDWLKKPRQYFSDIREVPLVGSSEKNNITIGKPFVFYSFLTEGGQVDVSGVTKGKGFAGVVKRHGFSGGPASHGGKLGRRPGGISFMRSQGRVIKGKKLPGHLGNVKRMVRNLDVIKVDNERKLLLVKGSVPGAAGSLVFLQKKYRSL